MFFLFRGTLHCVWRHSVAQQEMLFCEARAHALWCHGLVGQLTRFRLCDRHCEHYQANTSITTLYLYNNKIGDGGATALAEALKATLVEMFRHRRSLARA